MSSMPLAFVMNRKPKFAATASGPDGEPLVTGRAEVPMFKPIVVEVFVIFLAAVSYLVERHPGTASVTAGAAGATAKVAAAARRPGSDAEQTPDGLNTGIAEAVQPVRQMVALTIPISGTLSQDERQPGALQLVVYIDDGEAKSIKPGQELGFRAASMEGQSFAGQVAAVAAGVDPAASSLQVRFTVPNPQHLLRPGMDITGELGVGERIAWVVPRSAVLHLGDTDYIIVRDGRRYRRVAVTGRPLETGRYAITGGLAGVVPTVVGDVGLWLNQLAGEG